MIIQQNINYVLIISSFIAIALIVSITSYKKKTPFAFLVAFAKGSFLVIKFNFDRGFDISIRLCLWETGFPREAEAQSGSLDTAKSALLNVAARNNDIKSVSDLPASKDEVLSFIQDERARELFQEGLRLYDLRRWDTKASVYAILSPNITFTHNNYKISDLVFPIPAGEINAGFGVTQNDGWASVRP